MAKLMTVETKYDTTGHFGRTWTLKFFKDPKLAGNDNGNEKAVDKCLVSFFICWSTSVALNSILSTYSKNWSFLEKKLFR